MSVDKVILRAFLSTLAAIFVLFAFMFVTLVVAYPSTMMEITYDLGMDSSSIRHAQRAYKRSDDVYYIAYATEVAIGMRDYEKIESCGETFIADDGFTAYCAAENENLPEDVEDLTYEQYVYGQVCVAKYENGKKAEAVERAFELTGSGFPQNNAVVAVLYTALGDKDEATVTMIKGKMNERQPETLSEEDKAYFDWVLMLTNG